jgi:hypothetical protein
MSDTILGGNWTIFYEDENRQKRLKWTGSATGTNTANELYSAIMDFIDEGGLMDDSTPMSAETPVEYTVGIIDSGDLDPWYIGYESMQHITGGAIRSAGWTHVDGSAVGIIVVPVTGGGTIVAADEGLDITGATTGAGTLLEVIEDGATDYLVIRPDTNAAGSIFTTAAQTITCNGHTASQSGAVSHTGEQVWANFYSIATLPIEPDTHLYLYQGPVATNAGRERVVSIADATQDWWGDGHIDVTVFLKDFRTAAFSVIDGGYVSGYARKGGTKYAFFEASASTTSGGRNPIALSTEADADNTTGYKSITFTASSGTWAVGDEMVGSTSGARGMITQIDSPGATQTVHYVPLGDPQTAFQTAAENLTNSDNSGTGTKNGSAPADQGPALAAWFTSGAAPTIAFGNAAYDVDDDGTTDPFAITIDCNQNPLTEVYEWTKYITRRGATGTGNTNGIPGEMYLGGEVYLKYTGSVTGLISEGSDVTQETSGATGIVMSHDTSKKVILLRNTRGTFGTGPALYTLTDNDTGGTVEINSAAAAFAPKAVAPFGTLAGGIFFGARGVLLSDWMSADENSFQLLTVDGDVKSRPVAIVLSVTNLVGGAETETDSDHVSVWRLTGTGGVIDKTEFSAAGGEAIGAATLTVDGAIPQDVPGKTTGGVLCIRDASDSNAGYQIRYSSWSGSVFTLANIVIAAADGGTNTTTIVEAGAFANAKRGDIVVNHSRAEAVSYVVSVDSANQVTISPAITGQTTGDSIELNCVPIAMNTADDVYVPLMLRLATGSSENVSIVYVAPIDYRVSVRNNRNATKIKPFTTDGATSGADVSVATIRQTNTIAT